MLLEMPDARFSAIHLDLVGPLPESEGHSYLLTVVDRYSRWMEAIPLTSITAESCALALLRHWVSHFGVPTSIVTDRGRQFTCGLWRELSCLLGVTHNQTTSYHPQSNGMVERLHRTLKDRLMSRASASGSSSWMSHLPFVLLGLRSSVRVDSGCSPADMLYGGPLRLPGDMFADPASTVAWVPLPPPSAFAAHLRSVMSAASPMPVLYHGTQPSHVDSRLHSASHVFIRVDSVRRPLSPPYEGPFPVLSRSAKSFDLQRNNKTMTVSIDRLKPALFLPVPDPLAGASLPSPGTAAPPVASPAVPDVPPVSPLVLDPAEWPLPTRSGVRPLSSPGEPSERRQVVSPDVLCDSVLEL